MFNWKHVVLEAVAYLLPDQIVRSEEIERQLAPLYKRFHLQEGRLELMSGIAERRVWPEGTVPSEPAAVVGQLALQKAGIQSEDVECLIYGAVSRDFLEPATASVVHDRLRLPARSMMFDLSNACLGFVNGMTCLANMIELKQVRRGLIVAAENSRHLLATTLRRLLESPHPSKQQLKSAFASLTIGSGAAAMVLAHDSVARVDQPALVGGSVRISSQHHTLCRGSEDVGFGEDASMTMVTDSEGLLRAGCSLAKETWSDFLTNLQWKPADIRRTICHQVGAAHRDALYESLELDPKKDFSTFERLGNMGSASLPVTLAMSLERDPPLPAERAALLGIGSGLSSQMVGLQW